MWGFGQIKPEYEVANGHLQEIAKIRKEFGVCGKWKLRATVAEVQPTVLKEPRRQQTQPETDPGFAIKTFLKEPVNVT